MVPSRNKQRLTEEFKDVSPILENTENLADGLPISPALINALAKYLEKLLLTLNDRLKVMNITFGKC